MSKIVEIRWHGRGGQGAKTACLLLADAAFSSGKYVQGFPEYGPERMGAPITAYNRISDERCDVHSFIYRPDYVVVVDESLLDSVDVTAGLSPEGAVIINKVAESEVGVGFDAYNEEYVDMIQAGILDPAKVTRSALQNATSVASTLLTTESVVADIKEPAPAAPAGAGMGGMM